ncbi:MAG: hypothetical protein CBD18_02475 [Opitutales bacterium TMED158]|nr:MAG: hypothetical protein CBD18_02475 [Opitutales bacterium TMED158]|tara:strand:+ start:1888 stop:2259 length:372 start_codon:yes stop_codon:yes gene_type:complete
MHKEIAQRITDMVTGAIEGGSTYWFGFNDGFPVSLKGIPRLDENEGWYNALSRCLRDEEAFHFTVRDDYGDIHTGTSAGLWNAWQLMQEKHYRHFRDMVAENDDATTSDVFLQLALFSEVVYG